MNLPPNNLIYPITTATFEEVLSALFFIKDIRKGFKLF